MKATVLTTILFTSFTMLNVFAQRPLDYQNHSKENEIYPLGKNTFARVTISVNTNLHPYFKYSDMQKTPTEIDTLGDKVYYHLDFNVTRGYETINLEINVNDFSPFNLKLDNLKPNQWVRYYIYDPEPTIVDCYNQLMRESMKLFTNGTYEEAKKKYESIRNTCSKIDEEKEKEIDLNIALIDSIIKWRNLGEADFARTNYGGAIEYFQKIIRNNSNDKYASTRLTDARTKQREDCAATFQMAENYFNKKDYKNARLLYEKVVGMSCYEFSTALEKIQKINDSEERSHALTYECSRNVSIGLSTGGYKTHKSSGYFTIRLNSDLFELARTEGDEKLKPELNISFGWTLHPVKVAPVWLFFGPGYTGVGQYVAKKDDAEKLDLKIYHAISPEIGLLGKIIIAQKVGFALRYTLQYRFALEKETIDYIGKTRHVFGIGFCF